MSTWKILTGDCVEQMRTLPDASVQCCVTSPPYFGLRDYGVDGQIGLEPTPAEYVERLVAVFREVRRVLRDDGTCWVNLGDSYAANAATSKKIGESHRGSDTPTLNQPHQCRVSVRGGEWRIKAKDLVGIPWRVAFALQADGWWLRQDIIWAKPNPMPESVTDRCTKAHEYVFLLTKSARYFYDADAVRLPVSPNWKQGGAIPVPELGKHRMTDGARGHQIKRFYAEPKGANRRSVWAVPTKPYRGAHFAVMPEALVEPCVKAGSQEGGLILDPFAGSGTVGAVAVRLGRQFVGCELNPEYVKLVEQRIGGAQAALGLFAKPPPSPRSSRTRE